MEVILPAALLTSLILTAINFFAYLRNSQWGSALTQLSVWAAGVLGVFLFAQTDFGGILIPGTDVPFDVANGPSLVFIGLTYGASATVVNEFKKALDGNDSAAKPKLFNNPSNSG
jgi:hypothetical protein